MPKGNVIDRAKPEEFDLDVMALRAGYYSAVYFNRAKTILAAELPNLNVVMQVFQKNRVVLAGMDEALAVLYAATGHWSNEDKALKYFAEFMENRKLLQDSLMSNIRPNVEAQWAIDDAYTTIGNAAQDLDNLWVSTWETLDIEALFDAMYVDPWEPVAHIRGPLAEFAHLESVYLGILARRTAVATNTRRVVDAARNKPVLFFADRFDDYHNQEGDGYAAMVGGATGVATPSMTTRWGGGLQPTGTMPHALIAACKGSVSTASLHFKNHFPDTPLVALVDFHNDCARDAVHCYNIFGDDLWGVRLDTSENMVDESVWKYGHLGNFKPTGVNVRLVEIVRGQLDKAGGKDVRIIVSGGFNPEKINAFEDAGAPVDSYAVGSSLLKGGGDFTADVVEPKAKEGREYRDSDRLELVTYED